MSAANIATPLAENGHHSFDHEKKKCLPTLNNITTQGAKDPLEINTKLGVQFGPSQDFVLDLYNTNLPDNAPIALWVGGRGGALGLRAAGVKLVRLRPLAQTTAECLLAAAKNAVIYVFGQAVENQSRGVYLIGHGIGALLVSKLLADKQLIKESSGSHLLQAVYFVAGVFEINENIRNQLSESNKSRKESINSNSSSTPASPSKEFPKKTFMIEDLLNVHLSFEDRKNLSFICDVNNSSSFDDDNAKFSSVRKFNQARGLVITSEDALKKSPVFQNVFDFTDDSSKTGFVKSIDNSYSEARDEDLESALDDVSLFLRLQKDLRITHEDSIIISALDEDFSHLRCTPFRVNVFAADGDGQSLVKQSRQLFEQLTEGCELSGFSHFEIKNKVDSDDIKDLLEKEDNFLRRMIRYDIIKYL